MTDRVRLVLHNTHILGTDPAEPLANALAILDSGRILAVSPHADLDGPDIRRIDLNGRIVVPGFNDCHMHLLPYGLDLSEADLSPAAGVTSVPDLLAALRRWADENPGSEWALGNRYDQNTFPGALHPMRQDLDSAFPDRPVFITQTSKHAASANSVALRLAGVTRDTPNPEGGEIVRDAAGEPTGVLLESAMGLVDRLIRQPDKRSMVAAIHRANRELLSKGITSASDLHVGWLDLETEVRAYQQAAQEGAPIRTTLFPHAPSFGKPDEVSIADEFRRMAEYSEYRSGRERGFGGIRPGPIKLFSDGALTVRTAAMREPYVDGSGSGMLLHPPEELKAYIAAAHRRDWQIATHAIGDRAIELVLDAYREADCSANNEARRQTRILPLGPPRHRIEHAMLLDEGLIRRFVEQRVLPVIQPEFISRLGDAYVLGLGEERAARLNAVASLQRAGLGVAFSSDCPIVPGAPLDGIRAAARRITRTGRLLGPDERVSVEDGLRSYTYWAAYSTFDEHETGTITPGKRADLAILSADPTVDLDAAEVVATMVAGEFVYGGERFD